MQVVRVVTALAVVCRDYRWEDYPAREYMVKHPQDNSLMTYRGHHVLATLIRAYFSPLHSTAQRYIYAGSHDGSVYIFGEALLPVTVLFIAYARTCYPCAAACPSSLVRLMR